MLVVNAGIGVVRVRERIRLFGYEGKISTIEWKSRAFVEMRRPDDHMLERGLVRQCRKPLVCVPRKGTQIRYKFRRISEILMQKSASPCPLRRGDLD